MKQISAREVNQLLKEGKSINLIDVREASEVATGKIPGAVHIPLSLIEFRLPELDKSKEYIVVCYSGARSYLATQLLEQRGFIAINMNGGMLAWTGELI